MFCIANRVQEGQGDFCAPVKELTLCTCLALKQNEGSRNFCGNPAALIDYLVLHLIDEKYTCMCNCKGKASERTVATKPQSLHVFNCTNFDQILTELRNPFFTMLTSSVC